MDLWAGQDGALTRKRLRILGSMRPSPRINFTDLLSKGRHVGLFFWGRIQSRRPGAGGPRAGGRKNPNRRDEIWGGIPFMANLSSFLLILLFRAARFPSRVAARIVFLSCALLFGFSAPFG